MAVTQLELEDVQNILGRAVIDPDFRARLVADPEDTLKILGFGGASPEALAFFGALNSGAFPQAAHEVENRLGGRAVVGLWI